MERLARLRLWYARQVKEIPVLSLGDHKTGIRWTCGVSATLVVLFLVSLTTPGQRKDEPYAYACDSKTFDLRDFGTPKGFALSHDRQKRIVLNRNYTFAVLQGKKRLSNIRGGELSCCIEVGWSPDSTQFFLMWSGGGNTGEWYVRVFRIVESQVNELSAPRTAYADFKKHHSCKARSNNIFVLGWTPDSQKLFLVAEVNPSSDCEEMGLFRGYLMDANTGVIEKIFDEKETNQVKKNSRMAGVVRLAADPPPDNR